MAIDMNGWNDIRTAPNNVKVDVWVWNIMGDAGEVDEGFRWPEVYVIGGGAPEGLKVYREEPDFDGEWVEYWPHENGQVVSHWRAIPDGPEAPTPLA